MTRRALVWIVLLSGSATAQESAGSLQKGLDSSDPARRREAAAALAGGEEETQSWLLREAGRGAPKRRRALLLAAALAGTPESLALVERAARKGARASEDRAWALLLYGAYHPGSTRDAEEAARRGRTVFEQNCLLAGWLSRARELPAIHASRAWRGRELPSQRALLNALETLAGRPAPFEARSVPEHSGLLLLSQCSGAEAISEESLAACRGRVPELWIHGCRRAVPRPLDRLRTLPPGDAGAGIALALYELDAADRLPAFGVLDSRLVGARARSWLWGAAGDLGMPLPAGADRELDAAEVGGVLRLALHDPAAAHEAVVARRNAARRRLDSPPDLRVTWPAAVLLALGPEARDLERLRTLVESAGPEQAARVHPIWQMASGRLDAEPGRSAWLRAWSRELGAGRAGYLDQEAGRWTTLLLVAGTRAAGQRGALVGEWPDFVSEPDHSRTNELYADLAELLLSFLYRWDLR